MNNPESTRTRLKEIDWQQLIETALTTSGSVGNIYNRFYEYSFLNQMLLRMQGVQEPVATYKRWQAVGRQVLRGSRAAAIVRPIQIPKKNENEEGEDSVTRFKLVHCLFGVSQTSGDELAPVDPPGWNLDQALARLQVRQVPFQLLEANTQGYSQRRDFAISPVAVDPLHTTFHELGHIVLGHTTNLNAEDYHSHRGLWEFQAEATAHLTMNELDQLDERRASHSRGYLQNWLRGQRPSDRAIRDVFGATDAILRAGRPSAMSAADVEEGHTVGARAVQHKEVVE